MGSNSWSNSHWWAVVNSSDNIDLTIVSMSEGCGLPVQLYISVSEVIS